VTRHDELELAGLCGLAWERREAPDFQQRVDAIADWWDRRFVRLLERRQRARDAVLHVLRETRP
jgi:hypothetical protein